MLTEQQSLALSSILDFLKSSDTFFCLKGYAGTGKSFTISHLVSLLPSNTKIIFTAPTNKAVRVLRGFLKGHKVITIHSLLGLVVKQKEGREILEAARESSIDKYNIVIIDECSMITEQLMQLIELVTQAVPVKIIFMGDPAQLPPVNESISRSFNVPQSFTLTEVIRQKGTSGILHLCSILRQNISAPLDLTTFSDVECYEQAEWYKRIFPYFDHGVFDANVDYARVIAYKNATVDKINREIQRYRYPDLSDAFAQGEPIVFSSPVLGASLMHNGNCDVIRIGGDPIDDNTVIFPTETESIVYSCLKAPGLKFGLPYYQLKLTTSTIPEIHVLDPAAERAYQAELQNLRVKKYWSQFFALKNAFANVRCAYAMTAHKSQGSTFDNVFVHVTDILSNYQRDEARKCLYVACSRPRSSLILNTHRIYRL